ncbi:tetratricopeptide repeat-containing sensor histidine kinase [Pedobacter sp. SD-b]|uniref:histidine kinase n=1 Tax=Pedobacter segetis TaxID=2793069 RepID=A0ABS1BI97_9SPHI|nr:tetratricopeptide repeat-containing sensor histidine kinase [Pedobacter segetis]MBK0382568.1 tetratricopeptide repeat-containing sensor histidine kinase [Pedobacter segetis]
MLKLLLATVLSLLFLGSNDQDLESKKVSFDTVTVVFNRLQSKKPSDALVDRLNNLAEDVLDKDYIQSLSISKKSLAIAENLGYLKGQAEALHIIGSSFNASENYTIALEQLDRAASIAKSINDRLLFAKINNTRGLLFINIGYFNDALTVLKQSLVELKQIDPNHPFIGAVLHNLGYLYLNKNNNVLAIQFFDQAINHNSQNINWLAQNYFERAVANKNLSNYDQAKSDAITAIRLSEKAGNFALTVQNLNLLGTISLNFDEYKKADQLLDKALELSFQHQLFKERLLIYKSLSRLNEKSQNYKAGFNIEKSYNKLYDSLFNKERYKQLDEFRVYYGAKQKQNENIALKKANLNKEIKIQNKNYFILAFVFILLLTVYLLWLFFKRGKRMDNYNHLLTKQNEEINLQKKKLEELSQWKSKFFSIISHDLRGPILSLKGMLSLYNDKLLSDDDLKLFMAELNKNFVTTSNLMDNLLMWSKSQMQGQKLAKQEIDVSKITDENLDVLKLKIDDKNLQVEKEITDSYAYADEESISIVIRNLLANAIKFSNIGGVITISSHKESDKLIVCVKDNGLGMSVGQISMVLKHTFYTTEGTKNEKGSGLGVLLCEEFVRKNGGRFWVESEMGLGSSFYFSLPLKK